MAQSTVREGYELQRPNRDRASSRSMKAFVVLTLLASAGLMFVITVGGWADAGGMQGFQIVFIGVYLIAAFYVARWNRGMLPIMAAVAVIIAIFTTIAAVSWFHRDRVGFSDPLLSAGMLGMLLTILTIVQLLTIVVTMYAFRQQWNVEVEIPIGERYDPERHGRAMPSRTT